VPPVTCRRSLPSFAIVKMATARSARPKNAMREASGEKVGKSSSLRFSSKIFSPPDGVATVSRHELRTLVKIRRVPSADRSGASSSPAPAVNGSGSPPPARICQSVRLPARAEENTIRVPSSVHTGALPSRTSCVSRRASPPSDGITQKSPFGPISGWKKAIDVPSGDSAGERGTP
jgi:hypothetical protein